MLGQEEAGTGRHWLVPAWFELWPRSGLTTPEHLLPEIILNSCSNSRGEADVQKGLLVLPKVTHTRGHGLGPRPDLTAFSKA